MNLKVKVGDRVFEVEVGDLRARPIRAIVDEEVFEVWPESKVAYTIGSRRAVPPVSGREQPQPTRPSPAPPPHSAVSTPLPAVAAGNVAQGGKFVRAPIPGVITALLVRPGDEVSVGQELCKLEAMKMNNSIRSNRSGKIEAIIVSVGQQVKHNETLMEFAE